MDCHRIIHGPGEGTNPGREIGDYEGKPTSHAQCPYGANCPYGKPTIESKYPHIQRKAEEQ